VTYAVNKNKRLLAQAIEDMEKTIESGPEMKEYQKKREELATEYATKNEAGTPKTRQVPGMNGEIQWAYDIPEQLDVSSPYRKKLAKLDKEYKEHIEKQVEKEKLYNAEFLEDDTDFQPFKVPLDFLESHETCPQNIMDLIWWMIKEPENA
jgi:selenocysteine lyase/cysteine desulfurase